MSRHGVIWLLFGSAILAGVAAIFLTYRASVPDKPDSTAQTNGDRAVSRVALERLPGDGAKGQEAVSSENGVLPGGARATATVRERAAALRADMDEAEGLGGVAAAPPKPEGMEMADFAAGPAQRFGKRGPQAATGGTLLVSARAPAKTRADSLSGEASGTGAGESALGTGQNGQDSAGGTAPSQLAGDPGGTAATPSGLEDDASADNALKPVVTPLDVVQVARRWQDDMMQVSFAVLLDNDEQTVTPNGLIICQQIPAGWKVVESDPPVEAVDYENGIAKWLFVGDSVAGRPIYSLSMRPANGNTGDWNQTRAWYTYREPDGQCREVAVIPYSGSEIQPPP